MSNETMEISNPEMLSIKPMVSIVMITYNHEKFLSEAIEGAISQITDFPYELIIGEDCSSDNTRQIAIEYQTKYPHLIRILYSENNVGVNRNYARTLFAARGIYIASCEGDDYWTDPSKLQTQVQFLNNNAEYVACYHDSAIIDENNLIVHSSVLEGKKNDYSPKDLQATKRLPTQTLCFKNVIEEFPPEFYFVHGADAFVISLLGFHGGAKYLNGIKPSAYRQHSGGIWSGSGQNKQCLDVISNSYWLAIYYGRISNRALSINFARMIIERVLEQFNIDIISLLKSTLYVHMRKPYNILRTIKRQVNS